MARLYVALFGLLYLASPCLSDPRPVDYLTVRSLALFAPTARLSIVESILRNRDLIHNAGVDTPERLVQFLAQVATETSGLAHLEERLNYSAARLRVIFPRRVTPALAEALAGNPLAIANHVYRDRLGNKGETDGWRYRGSGIIQVTGRGSFRWLGQLVGLPLETQPELLRAPDPALRVALKLWSQRNINNFADAGDVDGIRKQLNGSQIGADESKVWAARARRYLGRQAVGIDQAIESEVATTDFDQLLVRDGYLRAGEAGSKEATEKAINSWIKEREVGNPASEIIEEERKVERLLEAASEGLILKKLRIELFQ